MTAPDEPANNDENSNARTSWSNDRPTRRTVLAPAIPDRPTPPGLVRRYKSMGGRAHYVLAGRAGLMADRALCGRDAPTGSEYDWQIDYANQLTTCQRCVVAARPFEASPSSSTTP